MTTVAVLHLVLHIVVPGVMAGLFFRRNWRRAWLLMLATMIIDLDHLLATPVYDPGRCSIGFHPLHTAPALVVYVVMLFMPRVRVFGAGLVIHMALDGLDCVVQQHA